MSEKKSKTSNPSKKITSLLDKVSYSDEYDSDNNKMLCSDKPLVPAKIKNLILPKLCSFKYPMNTKLNNAFNSC